MKNTGTLAKTLCTIGLLFLAACTTTSVEGPPNPMQKLEAVTTLNDPHQPCWVSDISCRDTASIIANYGSSKDYANRQSAEDDAIFQAQTAAAELIKVHIRRIFQEAAKTASLDDQNIIKGIAGDKATQKLVEQDVYGARPILYTRRITVTQYNVPKDHWEAFALILLPKDMNMKIAREQLEALKAKDPSKEPLVDGAEQRLKELGENGWMTR